MRTKKSCANCGRTIGQLERSFLHEDHIVCGECSGVLASRAVGQLPAELRNIRKSKWPGCFLAIVATALATLLRWVLDPLLGSTAQFVTYFVAVVFSGAFGGWGPALLATGASALAVSYFFMEPQGSLRIQRLPDGVALMLFILAASSIAWIAGRLHAARRNAAVQAEYATEQAQTIRESNRILEASQQVAKLGWYILDISSGAWHCSNLLKELFGITDPAFTYDVGGWLQIVHPDDRRHMMEYFQRHVVEDCNDFDRSYRIVRPCDGQERWVQGRGELTLDKAGNAIRMAGVIQDITDRKQAEEKLQESEIKYRRLHESITDAFVEVDMTGRIMDFNSAYRDMMGYTDEELLQLTFLDLTPLAWHSLDMRIIQEQILPKGCSEIYQKEYRRKDGTVFPVELRTFLIRDDIGRPARMWAIVRDITERKKKEQELADARLAAEQACEIKDQFLAVLSHELRTPLTAVILAMEKLRESVSAGATDWLEMACRNAELEARLIDDLLDITRITRGKIELDRHPINLQHIIELVIEVCRADIDARGVQLEVKCDGSPLMVHGDSARLQQVFWNLLKNAVKFTPHGGRIQIRSWQQEQRCIVQFADNGAGIDAKHLSILFSAFEQADRSITRQFGGLGLGLAISKALVEMHGGIIRADSPGRGMGATFTVELPVSSADSGAPAQASRPEKPMEMPKPDVAALRILLVEDHADTARLLRILLRQKGHYVQHAGDVATALKMTESEEFDVMISDLGLPDGSGHDLMRELRRRGLPITGIAISGYGMTIDIVRSHEAGFVEHITKPVDLAQVMAALGRIATRR